MRIQIQDYVFDGKTYWVAVVDGATVSVAMTSLTALGEAIDAIAAALKTEGKPPSEFLAADGRRLNNGWTVWLVLRGVYLILDKNMRPAFPNLISEQDFRNSLGSGVTLTETVVAAPPPAQSAPVGSIPPGGRM